MRAMLLRAAGGELEAAEIERPEPGPGQVLVEIEACGVCRTDLHVLDGELSDPVLPLVPGHQIVGRVRALGEGVEAPGPGARVGVPWLGWSCGRCRFCRSERENLCPEARFTGYTLPGGYAEAVAADARYAFAVDERADAAEIAPLLCAGLIGYRALRMCGDAERLGLYGFGSSAHLVCQIAVARGQRVFAFTRPGDEAGAQFARSLGAEWAGGSDEQAPEPLDAAIVFAPIGALVPVALAACDRGGQVVCAGIHMSDIPSFPYADLWLERSVRSVANLTRRDGEELLPLAGELGLQPRVRRYPLEDAGEALEDLREGRLEGSAVLELAARD